MASYIATRAHNLTSKAIREGRLTRPQKCEACDSKGYCQAHHFDYAEPLDVYWLCCQCHSDVHGLTRTTQTTPTVLWRTDRQAPIARLKRWLGKAPLSHTGPSPVEAT